MQTISLVKSQKITVWQWVHDCGRSSSEQVQSYMFSH